MEEYHKSRRCSRDTYPQSYITTYSSIRRLCEDYKYITKYTSIRISHSIRRFLVCEDYIAYEYYGLQGRGEHRDVEGDEGVSYIVRGCLLSFLSLSLSVSLSLSLSLSLSHSHTHSLTHTHRDVEGDEGVEVLLHSLKQHLPSLQGYLAVSVIGVPRS